MIKILQVGLSSNSGGIETCIANYYRYLDKKSFLFDFIDIYGNGIAFENEFKEGGSRVFHLPNYKKHPLIFMYRLRDVVVTGQYDIIHINMLSVANILPIISLLGLNMRRVIIHSHNSAVPSGSIRLFLNAVNIFFVRKMKSINKWACGEKAGVWMWGIDFDEENIVNNAIEVSRFREAEVNKEELLIKYQIPVNSKIVGFIGHLVEQKNVFFLIDVMERLIQKDASVHLIVIGEGKLRNELFQKIIAKKLCNNIHFVGRQNKVERWYKCMDVFVLPSLFEGLPVVGVEAQAAGIPCLFSDRITKEIGITNLASFLSIEDIELWVNVLYEKLQDKTMWSEEFPCEYDIRHEIRRLENKYRLISEKLYV